MAIALLTFIIILGEMVNKPEEIKEENDLMGDLFEENYESDRFFE